MKTCRSIFFLLTLVYLKTQLEAGELKILSLTEPTFETPVSQLATEQQFYSPAFRYWVDELREGFAFHRKLWEFCYVCQVLQNFDLLKQGSSGLGFGVGTEPLPALFAKNGCKILASDQDFSSAVSQGWLKTDQYALDKNKLNSRGICEQEKFNELVDLRPIDMNNIPSDLKEFDFVWSCCSMEHLGSLQAGFNFFKKSLGCLKPGGVAVHTTEFNLSSDVHTVETGGTVIYRKQDVLRFALDLVLHGYEVIALNFHPGSSLLDQIADVPPYNPNSHVKLLLEQYICTSIGIVVKKPE